MIRIRALKHLLKTILQIVGERCTHVEKFIIPKELTYRFKTTLLLIKVFTAVIFSAQPSTL